MELTEKDIERLKKVLEAIQKGTATTYDKPTCIEALNAVLDPKCAVCRGPIDDDLVVVNERKMHQKCRSRYKG
ncbi:MAG: hypothetical protein GF416_09080 [Candidatus Altiarchaeales archaeon]|nr:hypothetical protein [Candidatus Altiarchaeales archaeon]MBD3417271.1 hypothetical protein [Candidatus Altiarchaeales archaeon]